MDDEGYDNISNDKEFRGNLIENFKSGLNFVMKSIGKSSVKGDIYRKE